ncbi:MAG: hypothetical protein H7238_04300 [Polaromonas sp.]|nr:hypothetical protein [Polaromonas sp.]
MTTSAGFLFATVKIALRPNISCRKGFFRFQKPGGIQPDSRARLAAGHSGKCAILHCDDQRISYAAKYSSIAYHDAPTVCDALMP